MNIAIDLDGTIDQHISMWNVVVRVMEIAGHNVFLVTSRSGADKQLAREYAESVGICQARVICTGGAAKRWFCEQRNLKIDVWIDDDPGSIENGK